jgi:multidrug efflux pump subunit AcrA (membrane-fusion protein)
VIAAEVDGRVIEKSPLCEAGKYVKAESVLLRIDPRDYQLEIDRLTELVAQVGIDLEELKVERKFTDQLVELAKSEEQLQQVEFDRQSELLKQGAGAQKEVDRARREWLTTQTALNRLQKERSLLDTKASRLESEKRRLQADLAKAKLNLERTTITAPINGVVMEDAVEKNGYVSRGTMLAKLEDNSKAEVRFQLEMDELRWLWQQATIKDDGEDDAQVADRQADRFLLPQLKVTVSYEIQGQEFAWDGYLSRYDGAGINAATRTVPCIAVIDDPRAKTGAGGDQTITAPPALMRGMFVKLKMNVPLTVPLLRVPEVAIRPGNHVWLVRDEAGKKRLKVEHVNVVHLIDSVALIMPNGTALTDGDQVIVSPLSMAVDGMEVRTDDASDPSSADHQDKTPSTSATGTQP